MPWESRIPQVAALEARAINRGLIAAAYTYTNAMKVALAGGYTSGDFVTGNVQNSVTYQREATPTPTGAELACGVNVGNAATTPSLVDSATGEPVDLPTVARYALAWELGHVNLFTARRTSTTDEFFATGGYQRVEIWRPVLVEQRDAIRAAFARVHAATLAGGAR